MFTRILVGYDGSAEAGASLRLAKALARDDATLIIAHVRDPASDPEAAERPDGHRRDPDLTSARVLLSGWPDVELCACSGPSVASELHRVARETMCDLIVVGASRHHGAGRVLLGSNTEATLHGAPCPVVVSTTDPRTPIRRIGVAFDGTRLGRRTVVGAGHLAASLGSALTVLGVVDTRHAYATFGTEGGYGDVRIRAKALMTEAVAGIHGVARVQRQLHEGDPVHECLALGRDHDLLVLGSRSNGLILRLLLGSVSSKVVRRAGCPVLVLPADVPVPVEERSVTVTTG